MSAPPQVQLPPQPPEDPSSEDLEYLVNHVFLPPKLPHEEEQALQEREEGLARAMFFAAKAFAKLLPQRSQKEWGGVVKMLKIALKTMRALDKEALVQDILLMEEGDVIPFHVRAQNAAVFIRRQAEHMYFEAFEVSPPPDAIMSCKGKLLCSFPGPAVRIPLDTALELGFVRQTVSYLIQMDQDKLDTEALAARFGGATRSGWNTKDTEARGSTDPRYITQLLMFILQGMGKEAEIRRVTKRVGDEVCGDAGVTKPFRRSGFYTIGKLAVQLTVESAQTYKGFMVFFQTELLRYMLKQDVPSELVHVARAKTARRIYKMEVRAETRVAPKMMKAFEAAMKRVGGQLQGRWEDEQRMQGDSVEYVHDPTKVEEATVVLLRESRDYLKKVLQPQVKAHVAGDFNPSNVSRLREAESFTVLAGNGMHDALEKDPYVALADFEWLVQEKLDAWVEANKGSQGACQTLSSCWDQYYKKAQEKYANTQESESVMILTLLELWVGIDVVASRDVDLIPAYSCEIPFAVLDKLLLRRAKDLERARKVEEYLRGRHKGVRWPVSVFSTELEDMSFSTQYYRRSHAMQELKRTIERAAEEMRETKRVLLRRLNAKYRELQEQISRMGCDYSVPAYEGARGRHLKKTCGRCKLVKEQEALRIEVHEWPLPSRMYETEAVCFELRCPPVYAIWREKTYELLRDVFMKHVPMQNRFSPHTTLGAYDGLAKWRLEGRTSGRVMLGSETRPLSKSLTKTVSIPADEEEVFVDNGLKYRLYDSVKGENLVPNWDQVKLESYCTLKLPPGGEGLYKHLQYAVTGTSHTHNETIVDQGDCPRNLSLHEQLAFTNLRCGPLLQWLNIARELRTNTLTFSREEVHTLVTQAAWQIGPLVFEQIEGEAQGRGVWKREWHRELEEPEFGMVLVREAEDMLKRVEANWMEGVTVKTIIYLISRLLASVTTSEIYEEVRDSAYAFLRKARRATHTWTREILAKLQSSTDDAEAAELQRRACDMACTCRATFDVDPGPHLDALLATAEDVEVLLECAIIVHDNKPPRLNSADLLAKHPDYVKLLRRDARLSVMLEGRINAVLSNAASGGVDGLNRAIKAVWSEYRHSTTWKYLAKPSGRWLVTETQPAEGTAGEGENGEGQGQVKQKVHLNLLDGQLLVDGRSLGRLPSDVVGHPTYKRVFGQKILDVIPADMPGMDYASRTLVHGCQVFFALRDENKTLIIRARTPARQVLELIPHTVLLKDFPTFFATEHAHWMDLASAEVEFRPLTKLWEASSLNWRLLFFPDGRPARMVLSAPGTPEKKSYLLDVRSEVFTGIAERLKPLEVQAYLSMVYDPQTGVVSIELPRFRLSFFVNDMGELESKNMQGMIVDSNQSAGTLIGLRTRLVLKHKDPAFLTLPRSRCILIPHGFVRSVVDEDKHHVRVYIDTTGDHFQRRVKWFKYDIDTDLGYLAGNVNLTSRLFRIYLHALTSHPLPDPLTSQTGTDHALQELRAAGCFSFQKLADADIKLLHLIGGLTPKRYHLPKQTRIMQSVKWSENLPALSQHGGFDGAVAKIFEYAVALKLFDDKSKEGKDGQKDQEQEKEQDVIKPKEGAAENEKEKKKENELEYKSNADAFLMERAMRRNAIYYEGGPESESLDSAQFDRSYEGRSSPHFGPHEMDGIEAMKTSRLVFDWPVGCTRRLETINELLDTFIKWNNISGPVSDVSLEYKLEWHYLDLPTRWLTLYNLCRQIGADTSKKFELVFLFGFLAYAKPEMRRFIPIFLAFATMPRRFGPPPAHSHYNLGEGFEPKKEKVKDIIQEWVHDVANSPAGNLAKRDEESKKDWQTRQRQHLLAVTQPRIKAAVDALMAQSRSANPASPFTRADDGQWFSTSRIMARIRDYFGSCASNSALHDFMLQISGVLQANVVPSPFAGEPAPRFSYVPQLEVDMEGMETNVPFVLGDLLAARTGVAPKFMEHEFGAGAPGSEELQLPGQFVDTNELKVLFGRFRRSRVSVLTPLYCDRLEKSRLELHGQEIPSVPDALPPMESCVAYRDQCRLYLKNVLASIRNALAPSTAGERVLEDSRFWSPIHPRSLLYPLAATSGIELGEEWTAVLVAYAEAFIEYQHAQRLVGFALHGEVDNFYKELRSARFDREESGKHPDWLLIQIQGNFIIRSIQSAVAAEMISPSSGTNTVLQLNMGEGKSHVIVPIVATALADSHKLVRVVVLKPLASQMFHSLVERISGITNRRVFYLPFSRDVKMGPQQIKHIRSLFEECARVRGVLVTQPEHILSFRLMVVDRMLASGCPLDDVARGLYDTQEWLRTVSRDILDESDELLHVRYQLIYTMNEQQPLDDGPARWITTQKVLDLVRRHISEVQDDFPDDVELLEHHGEGETVVGAFTYSRLLGSPAAQDLISRIAEDIVNGAIDTLNITGLGAQPRLRNALLKFIKEQQVNEPTYRMVESTYKGSGLWKGLLLLRGLLGHGILVYVLSKQRWRVDYGLDLKRSLLAVPYRAKDMPSLRSEFGHPDVAVCLTCLSYYYGGLNPQQVRECFDLLFKLDNPPQEYEKWVRRGAGDIPVPLRQLIGVNTKDIQTFMNNVVPIFQHNQATIDFFLSQVVFPKEAKEFPHKLGTSGWDLVEEPVGDNFVTGFSGTNDNSDLLPTSITQSDPVNQLRTNAQVLEYLLRPENDRYFVAADMYGQPCSAMEFLEHVVREPQEVRVLLDVGAQMLEMTNLELVRHWLSLRKDIAAGVFVDDEDRLSVLTQDGIVEPFYSSPFSQRLQHCVVYLDDAHTRGTDIKLPRDFRAVVTLGPKVTKDRLVQGCMRMRKLGHGQSVLFYATPEIDRRIRESEILRASRAVKVVDVLSWVMAQTCTDIEHHVPHWVQQGVDYNNRRQADLVFSSSEKNDIRPVRNVWLQPARRTLDEMYGLSNRTSPYDEAANEIPSMQERLRNIGIKVVRDTEMEEEQEREVSHEVEQELQLERPPKVEPATHRLDGDVQRFVKKGILPPDSNSFLSLFKPLRSLDDKLDPVNSWNPRLLCTRDFQRTTRLGYETAILTEYLRPVHWIISYAPPDGGPMAFVVMSPHEVNALLPSIRKSKFVHLHMYAPRTIQAMKPMDDLLFYCIPPLPDATPDLALHIDVRCQLNIWAGQLYFDDHEYYIRLCFLLGISPNESKKYELVESDRFVPEKGRVGDMLALCMFNRSPIRLLRTLAGLRRKGMSFENTHLGKVLHARILSPEDFEEAEEVEME